MKKVLHFFGEFLVETWGCIQASDSSESNKADNIGTQKQKFIKWPVDLVSTSDGEASDDINAVVGNLLQKQSEKIKRHKRRDLSKLVDGPFIIILLGFEPPQHKLKPDKLPFRIGGATQDKDCPLWTRYLLRYTAIEVYFNDSAALNFASNKEAKDVGSLIVATRNELVFPKGYRDKAGVISFVDRRVSMKLAETAKEKDYTSDFLDFNKSSIFHDHSKPVGSKTVFEVILQDLNQTSVSENQFSFMPGRSSIEGIHLIRSLMEKYRERQRDVHLAFIDLEKAYDSVPQDLIWKTLIDKGASRRYIKVIRDMYNGAKTRVRTSIGNTEFFSVEEDIPWCMIFADDIVLVSESAKGLNDRLENWREALEANGFRVSREKTAEYIRCDSVCNSEIALYKEWEVCIGDKILQPKESFRYLGSMLHKSGRIDEDVTHRIKATWLKPAMLYGSECWPITKALANRMEVAELRMLRWTCGKTMLDMIPNGCIGGSLECETIINKMREEWLRWFGHVRRRPQSTPVRRVEALVVDDMRRRGRPKLRWDDRVKLDMKELLLSKDMTSDRNEWRARTSLGGLCASKHGEHISNCLSNTSDVKELVPQFYYMPEFLVNSNFYHLGVKQDGEPLNDVGFPPWPRRMTRGKINGCDEERQEEHGSPDREALESGKPAANIFYYVTYEGDVDLETMEDELQRSAIEDQIANFGQTPIQLFPKKHPRRGQNGQILIGSPLVENIELGAQCFTKMQTPSGNFLVSCGNWENSFQLISLNDGRLVQSVPHHKDVSLTDFWIGRKCTSF
ncbi:retrovirus-related pol polyprotein LINE-1 [Tanacetum coccineum]